MSADRAADATSRHPQLPEPLRSAVINHEDGKLDAAYPLYRQYVADNPKNPTALQLFGLLLSQIQQIEPAIALMRESLKLFPDQPEVANNLGNALLKAGQFDDAIESYSDALRLLPKYADAERNLGWCYSKIGRFPEARDCFDRCIEWNPNDATAWFSKGNLNRQQGDTDAAIGDFERALELRPDYAEAHHNLGLCLRLSQRPREALDHYETARTLGLTGPELLHNMGNVLIDMQQAGQAIDMYRAALETNPADLDTHKNLNSLLWQQELLDDHLKSYRVALETMPEAEPLRLAWATALNQAESYGEAEQVLRDGLQYTGESSALKSLLAYTLEGQGRWDEALKMHASAVKTPGSIPNQAVSYGRALLARGQPEEALRQIQGAAAQTPYNQRALAYLGLCWRMLGDERDAVLNDYDNLVRTYKIPVPEGYASLDEFNEKLRAVFDSFEGIAVGGHTHHPGMHDESLRFNGLDGQESCTMEIPAEGKFFINVGSTGQPRDGDNRACYAVLEDDRVTWNRVAYDYRATMQKILDTGELSDLLARRLTIGK